MLPNATKRMLQAHRMKIVTTLLTVVILSIATFFAYTAYASGQKTLTFIKDGKESVITTRANTVQELLQEQNIHLDKQHDAVQPSLETALEDKMTVKWKPAHKVVVSEAGSKQAIWTTAATLAEMLDDKGITIGQYDTITPNADTKIDGSMNVTIKNGIKVTVYNQAKQDVNTKAETTLDQFVKQQHIQLNKDDKLQLNDKLVPKDSNQVLKNNDKIYIHRVSQKTITEPIDYDVVQQDDSSLEKGQTRVLQSGQEGAMAKTYKVTTMTDQQGTHEQKDLIQSTVTKEPKKKIIAVGTKVVQSPTPSEQAYRGTSGEGGKVLYVKSTAFTANCKGCRGITSLGINLKSHPGTKVIAVDPNVIPLGSKVWVEGYGYAIAGDTGGGIHGNKIDVFFPSQSQAHGWGLRTVKVKILN
ncbi:hypothetical protein GCM10011391_36040 [Pullulanibacillus camelliae]|uniref:G5 domain-containing protein n=1 Tax=Pullulanibacillus camelliae TaxID=1707096 RepID=A0A8J2YML9_9BACL|nr:G5 and 3D domain-containing protein [Pullulanibacillus camelliae]GGE53949.1 hypothetical protein GCM10011391_36040 [Pullulanibacillus camelliae]